MITFYYLLGRLFVLPHLLNDNSSVTYPADREMLEMQREMREMRKIDDGG